jgi:hypothetical protein
MNAHLSMLPTPFVSTLTTNNILMHEKQRTLCYAGSRFGDDIAWEEDFDHGIRISANSENLG